MLKKLLASLGGIIALLLIVPVILPSKMQITRSIDIQSNPAVVHTFLSDLNNYPKWNPFSENDPSSTNQISGSGVGSFLTWKGEKTGDGKMTITQIQPPTRIQIKLEFYTPMAAEATAGWITESIDATKTRMTWTMDEDLTYFHRYCLLMKGMISKAFDRGLNNLKKQLEK